MAIEGPLKELGIHDVFQLLDLSRKTGVLRVTSDLLNNEGRVWFEDGAVLFAELRSNPHRLGEMLVRAGKITEAHLEKASQMQMTGDSRPIGELLVEIKAIREEELDLQIRFQTEEVIFEMMGWKEGHFSFEEGHEDAVPGDRITRIRTEALLMEGARRIDEWSLMERTIPNVSVIPTFTESDSKEGELDLVPAEWEVLAAIDGTRNLRAVAQFLARSEFDVAKTVFGLESAGVLSIAPPPEQPKPAAETPQDEPTIVEELQIAIGVRDFDRAHEIAERGVKAHPQSAELLFLMARVLRAQRDYAGAEEFCRKALRLDSLYTPSHRLLGDLLALQGLYTDAVEWWDRWLGMQENSDDPHPDAADVRKALAAAQFLHNVLKTNA